MGTVKTIKPAPAAPRPTRAEAEQAVEILLRYIGEDPQRPGLRETPARVVRSYDEFYGGYAENAADVLRKTFDDITGYDDFVLVKGIEFIAHCEHHMVPVIGKAHVAYWPGAHVVGLSKLARVVDIFARRLVTQETMTRQIGETIGHVLQPRGTAVFIDAVHHCMSSRGIMKPGSSTVTSFFSGIFADNADVRTRFLESCRF